MKKIIDQVNHYYTSKIETHGATPQGVDWNSTDSQELRFEILSKVMDEANPDFSILDYGCGFGSMLDFYLKKGQGCFYTGFDVSAKMIAEAQNRHPQSTRIDWTTEIPQKKFDYVIASGIFNVKLENTNENWYNYITETLNSINDISDKGFSFNILTSYSDKEYMKDYLYYADPLHFFDYCKKHFSKNVALLHDYNLYEFTIIVRKQ